MKTDQSGPRSVATPAVIPSDGSRLTTFVVLAIALLGPPLWYFGPALATGQGFAFRDGAHYYHPLFQWISRQWASGQIPLWNPLENCGVPVLADATSSVFYPPKLLFALPLPYTLAYKLFVLGHIMLAATTSFRLARHWQTSRLAAGLCAVSYAFGGNVLFQYCNVVYLVGAAWLPLALLAGDQMLTHRRLSGAFALAVVLALMVLGGDPQMAYNAGLLVVLHAALLWWCRLRDRVAPQANVTTNGNTTGHLLHHCALLSLAAFCAFLFSAIQVLPSSQWTRHCQRAVFQDPRSISEIPAYLARSDSKDPAQAITQGILGDPAVGTHQEHIYHFSVGPWRLAELVWPNVSGRMFPINRRWTNLIPAEGRIWTPSLYAGLLPLLLGLSAWRVRGGDHVLRWVSWMTLLAVLAAFGWYGLGWLLQELRCAVLGTAPKDTLIGAPVGGLYWLMVVFLPGYALFRFPAKLLVIAALGLSLLAARGLDRAASRESKGLRYCLGGLAVTSLLGLSISFAMGTQWAEWTQGVPADALFGPYDAVGALADLRLTMFHAALLGGLSWWLLERAGRWHPQRVAVCLLLVTAVDLAAANGWMILTAPDSAWLADSDIDREIWARNYCNVQGKGLQPFRVLRGSRQAWWPDQWTAESDIDRARQGLRWDRATLHPKYHLARNLSLVESYGSCTSYDYLTLLRAARNEGPKRPDGVSELVPNVVNLLGARYLVLPGDFAYPETRRLVPQEGQEVTEDRTLWYNPHALPRAWIVHDVVTLPPLADDDPSNVGRRARHVLSHKGTPRDFHRTAVVETDSQIDLSSTADTTPAQVERDWCWMMSDTAQRMELSVELERPGLLVVSDTFYPGWSAEITTGDQSPLTVPILRTNRVMRGVILPEGKHNVVFQYRPTMFYIGATISAASWAILLVVSVAISRRGRAA